MLPGSWKALCSRYWTSYSSTTSIKASSNQTCSHDSSREMCVTMHLPGLRPLTPKGFVVKEAC